MSVYMWNTFLPHAVRTGASGRQGSVQRRSACIG